MNKTLGIFGTLTALVMVALFNTSPAEADSFVYLDLYDVSCNADTDTVSFSVNAVGGDYELPVLIVRVESEDGTTDQSYATALFDGYIEDTQNIPYEEDFQIDDDIVVYAGLYSNDESDELLTGEVNFVECTGIQIPTGGYQTLGGDDDGDGGRIDDVKTVEEDTEEGSTFFSGYRPQFYFK